MEDILTKSNKQPAWQFFLFSFFSIYFFIYIFPFPIGYNGNVAFVSDGYYKVFNILTLWLGRVFFHRSVTSILDNGSGDRIFNYVQSSTMALLALVIVVAWYFFSKRKHSSRILYWVYTYIQLYISVTLVRYGLIKVMKAQFPFPYYGLTDTYAESSPLQLMTNFMGYSTVYNLFTGLVEVVAGVLILFRKTSLIGAIIAVIAMSNVVMINIGYDVPVKLHALHLLLIAIYIAVPAAGRLRSLFISDTSTHYQSSQRFILYGKRNPLTTGGIIFLTAFLFYSNVQRTYIKYTTYGDGAFQNTPLFGIYQVKTFIRNKDTLLPLITDTSRWKMLSVIYTKKATVKMMNDSTKLCRIITDTTKKTLTLADQEDTTYDAVFMYQQTDSVHLTLSGKLKNDSVVIWLEKQDLNKFRLVNHEFHWVHESLDYR